MSNQTDIIGEVKMLRNMWSDPHVIRENVEERVLAAFPVMSEALLARDEALKVAREALDGIRRAAILEARNRPYVFFYAQQADKAVARLKEICPES